MKPILKFLLRNIAEKKLRSLLVIMAISVATALVFTSGAISGTMEKIYTERLKQVSGTSDIAIFPKDDPDVSPFMDVAKAHAYRSKTEYIIGMVRGSALYNPNPKDMTYIGVFGIDLPELQRLNPLSYDQEPNNRSFTGNQLLVSKNTADKLGLHLGSTLQLEIAGTKKDFTVAGLCNPKGIFLDESQRMVVVMPKATAGTLLGTQGKVNTIFLKLKDNTHMQELIDHLGATYPDCTVKESLDKNDLAQELSSITTPLNLVSVFVILMSAFIIFTSFKLISLERLPVIGTFRSIGATKWSAGFIMALESVLFGVFGGITGCGLGIGAVYLISLVTRPEWAKSVEVSVNVNPSQMISAFVFAVVLSLVSALIPAFQTARIPVKDIVLNTRQTNSRSSKLALPAGLILLVASLVLPKFVPNSVLLVLILDSLCMVSVLVSMIMLLPYITNLVAKVLETLYSIPFGNEGALAARNIRGNKNILNTITLLTLGIACLLLVYTLNYSIGTGLTDFYKQNTKFDIRMVYRQADDDFVRKIRQTDGVTDATAAFEQAAVIVEEKGQSLAAVCGIDQRNYLDFWKFDFTPENLKKFHQLDSGRNIMLTNLMRERLAVKAGDTLTLDLGKGKQPYVVTGFLDTAANNGNMAVVSSKYLMEDTGSKYYNTLYIKTGKDAGSLVETLKRKYLKDILYIRTRAEMEEDNQKSIAQVFLILGNYSQLAMLIGIVGIINNLLVAFIERKRMLAIYRSVGMSRAKLFKILVIEATTGGLLGGIFGTLAAVAMMTIIPPIMKTMIGTIPMVLSLDLILFYLAAGIVIMLVASVIPALKSSKLSIIESIKYE